MNSSKNKILLDNLVDQRKGFTLAKTVIISSITAVVLVFTIALLIGYKAIEDSRRVESVIDMDGFRWDMITAHKEATLPVKYRHTAKLALYNGFCHNEYSYKEHMRKLSHLLDKKSYDLIEAEYNKEKRLNNLIAYNMAYKIDLYSIKPEDIIIDVEGKKGAISAIQERISGDSKIYVRIDATFDIYDYNQGVSDDNPHGVKLYNWKWSEEKIEAN